MEQIQQILSPERLEVRRNSEWLGTMGIEDVLRLSARTTVARMLERDDFAKRYASGTPISVMEFLYPLLQGWDSVMVQADVELGGTDQLWNLLLARQLQQQEGQAPQVVLTTPLLVGLDGEQKMSKSLGNYVGIAEPPAEQFGKLMSIPDDRMPEYYRYATGPVGDAPTFDAARPAVESKRALARAVVDRYHGAGAGEAAEAEFDRVFKSHDSPSDVPEHDVQLARRQGRRRRTRAGVEPAGRDRARDLGEGRQAPHRAGRGPARRRADRRRRRHRLARRAARHHVAGGQASLGPLPLGATPRNLPGRPQCPLRGLPYNSCGDPATPAGPEREGPMRRRRALPASPAGRGPHLRARSSTSSSRPATPEVAPSTENPEKCGCPP